MRTKMRSVFRIAPNLCRAAATRTTAPMYKASFGGSHSCRFFATSENKASKPDEQAPTAQEPDKEERGGDQRDKKPVSWGMVVATAVVCVFGVTYFQNQRMKSITQVKEGRVVGRPKLGGH